MKKNVGGVDRVLRIALAILCISAYATMPLATAAAAVVAVLALVFVATGIVGVCPLYHLIGINTCRSAAGAR